MKHALIVNRHNGCDVKLCWRRF